MRVSLCLGLFLSACAAPGVRCDQHLQPINPAAKAAPVVGTAPGAATPGTP